MFCPSLNREGLQDSVIAEIEGMTIAKQYKTPSLEFLLTGWWEKATQDPRGRLKFFSIGELLSI